MIETGVDKLISLVNDKKKISFKDAAKELGVDMSTIKEWSSVINDDNIAIEYKFTTPFLVAKITSSKEAKGDLKKLDKEKKTQFKKIEESISSLHEHRTGMEQAKERISGIKEELNSHVDKLQREINGEKTIDEEELKRYFMQRINAINKKIIEEEEQYEKFSGKIKKETDTLNESFKSVAVHLKQTADWINYFKEHQAEQEKKIKELEKKLSKR